MVPVGRARRDRPVRVWARAAGAPGAVAPAAPGALRLPETPRPEVPERRELLVLLGLRARRVHRVRRARRPHRARKLHRTRRLHRVHPVQLRRCRRRPGRPLPATLQTLHHPPRRRPTPNRPRRPKPNRPLLTKPPPRMRAVRAWARCSGCWVWALCWDSAERPHSSGVAPRFTAVGLDRPVCRSGGSGWCGVGSGLWRRAPHQAVR